MYAPLDLVAIKKHNTYYVRSKDKFPNAFADEAHLRFNIDRFESFSDKWLVFNALPTSAEHLITGERVLTGFQLKDGFQVTEQTPQTLPPDTFHCCDDECDNPEIRGLYESQYEKHPDTWETLDMSIELIDNDCEPLVRTKYTYYTDFPHYIDRHGVVQHKYPCHIKSGDVFKYIVKSIKAVLPTHCYITSDYDFHFGVEVEIPVLHEETHVVDKSRYNASKPKWTEVPLREVAKTIIDISTPNHDYGDTITTVYADNYYELEKKMDDIIQSYIDLLQTKLVMCPHCKGHGWTLEIEK